MEIFSGEKKNEVKSKPNRTCVSEREEGRTVSMEGVEIKEIQEFECIVSVVQSSVGCEKEDSASRVEWETSV